MSTENWVFVGALIILAYQFFRYQSKYLLLIDFKGLLVNERQGENRVSRYFIVLQDGYLIGKKKPFLAEIITLDDLAEKEFKVMMSQLTKEQFSNALEQAISELRDKGQLDVASLLSLPIVLRIQHRRSNSSPGCQEGEFEVAFDAFAGASVSGALNRR